jgi:hypothetical protein
MSEPTYTITVTVERSDAPGAKFEAVCAEIPRASAERADYQYSGAVQTFRQIVLNELEEPPAAAPAPAPPAEAPPA